TLFLKVNCSANTGYQTSTIGGERRRIEPMNLQYFIQRFSNNRGVFESLLRDVGLEQARWKPTADKWSMLEVVNHLYDEEREDFRQRLQLTLKNPEQAWPAINPRGWVVERSYNERELGKSLQDFLAERENS